MKTTGIVLGLAAAMILAPVASAQAADKEGPWTLQKAADLPEWLTVKGSFRARYETLSGQYRVGRSQNDQLVSLRSTLFAEARGERIRAGVEIFDSRGYQTDPGSSIGTSEVNVFEPVQAYVGIDLGQALGGKSSDLVLGRFTLDLGGRRLIGRNNFRNTTNAFTGAKLAWSGQSDERLTLFYTMPQTRLPSDRATILDNEFELDEESGDLVFWGTYYEKPQVAGKVNADIFLFGLKESDSSDTPTRNRDIYTPGARLFTKAAASTWDFELEAGWQFGTTRATTSPLDTNDLDVSAQYLHADIGYTFDAPWQPRLEVQYDYASGDGDRSDGEWTRFDSLYGPRRPDFGPTGLYGALSRVNISAPGIKLEVKPNKRWDGFVEYKAVWLADDKDVLDRSGAVDRTGASGGFVGNQLQARARYWIVPKAVRLDFGGAVLFQGEFLENAPNAPDHGDTTYGYADITWEF